MSEAPQMLFWQCKDCEFLFKDPKYWPTPKQEKARYEKHQNGNEGHLQFLSPMIEFVGSLYSTKSIGLDWGSGPVPVLAEALSKKGIQMDHYDPFFYPTRPLNHKKFDFITLTEVIEHVFDPRLFVNDLTSRLKPSGKLFVMTEPYPGIKELGSWSYRRDLTHVGFYCEKVFLKFSEIFHLELTEQRKNIFVFDKTK